MSKLQEYLEKVTYNEMDIESMAEAIILGYLGLTAASFAADFIASKIRNKIDDLLSERRARKLRERLNAHPVIMAKVKELNEAEVKNKNHKSTEAIIEIKRAIHQTIRDSKEFDKYEKTELYDILGRGIGQTKID